MSARSTLSGLMFALVIGACAPPANQGAAAPAAVDSAAVTAAVAYFWQQWITADTTNSVDMQLGLMADSARFDIRGMPPIVGRAAWKAVLEPMLKTAKYTSLMVMPDMTIPVTNELAYQNGSYMEGTTAAGKKSMEYGRYATALRKDPDGKWRFAYIMVFADSNVSGKK